MELREYHKDTLLSLIHKEILEIEKQTEQMPDGFIKQTLLSGAEELEDLKRVVRELETEY